MKISNTFVVVLVAVIAAAGLVDRAHAADDPALALFKKGGCDTCHSISALKIAKAEKKAGEAEATAAEKPAAEGAKKKEAPDLSGVGLEHDAKWISGYINKTESKDGEKHEKRFKGTEPERRTLAMWLAGLKHEIKKPAADDAAAPKKD